MDITKCPKCGNELESGVVGAESFFNGIRWYRTKSFLALGGELIIRLSRNGMAYADAKRCVECKLVLFEY